MQQFKYLFYVLLILGCGLMACTEQETINDNPSEAEGLEQLDAKLSEWQSEAEAEIASIEAELAAVPRSSVILEAGSVDGLAAAIAEAGPGGMVTVATGEHFESGTVILPFQVRIQGEDGAQLFVETDPQSVAGTIQPAFHILEANRCVISNLDIISESPLGGTAILVEGSDRCILLGNNMENFQVGIWVHESERTRIVRNEIAASPLALQQEPLGSFGVVVASGIRARVFNNKFSGAFCGIWACDRLGYLMGNELFDDIYGLILCKVPEIYNWQLPSGQATFAPVSANRWAVFQNTAYNNALAGYLIVDGANDNYLLRNEARNNAGLDFDFAGETDRFGFVTPTSFDNTGIISTEHTVLDCGENNYIFGGDVQDNSAGNCN